MAEPNAARCASVFPYLPSDGTERLTRFSTSLEDMAAAAVQEAIRKEKGEAERFVNNFVS